MKRRGEHGAAAVEMAVLLPLLVALLIGVTDVGWMLWKRIELQEAVQEGAIYFAYNPEDWPGVVERTVAATNVDLKPGEFQAPHCDDGQFRIAVEHALKLPVTGRIVPVRVAVEGDLLVSEGCP